MRKPIIFKNSKGQGLTEYLIIVAIMAVATIGIVRVLGNTVSVQFANITNALQGKQKQKIQADAVEENHYKKKHLGNFINGAAGVKANK